MTHICMSNLGKVPKMSLIHYHYDSEHSQMGQVKKYFAYWTWTFKIYAIICMFIGSYLAKDVCPLPLAVDRRGLDDQLDLGQVAAAAAAIGVPVHAAGVPSVPSLV